MNIAYGIKGKTAEKEAWQEKNMEREEERKGKAEK